MLSGWHVRCAEVPQALSRSSEARFRFSIATAVRVKRFPRWALSGFCGGELGRSHSFSIHKHAHLAAEQVEQDCDPITVSHPLV
jgi:hypothetical protein